MYCTKCGKELQEGTLFCCYCGEHIKLMEGNSIPQGGHGSVNESDRMEQIIGKNAVYYTQRFGELRNNGKDRMNWASLFLSFLHAGYRNIWKEWLSTMWLPMVVGWGTRLLYGIMLSVSGTIATVMLLGFCAANIWLLVAQILFAKRFNRLYMRHVEQKIAQNNLMSDPSAGRSAITGVALGLVNSLVNGIITGIIVSGMFSFAEEQEYIYDDYSYEENIFYDDPWVIPEADEPTVSFENNDAETAMISDSVTEEEEISWIGDFQRTYGPNAGIMIIDENEEEILFSVGIGESGYLAYLDMRACIAYKADDVTAYYYELDSGYECKFTYRADGSLLLEENMNHPSGLNLAGVYVPEDEAVYPDCEYVFSDSDMYEIFLEDSEMLTDLERKIARNEIYARHGYRFRDEYLQNYFESCSWYYGTIDPEEFSEDMLNEVERTNISILK